MRAEARYAILVVLVIGVLMALGLSLSGPLLYTLEKDVFPSRFHENTDVLKIKSLNSTSDIFPIFQDLIDFSGPIVLNLHIKDFDEARRLLENFKKSDIRVSNLVISLDMSESEMEEFSKSNSRQRELLQQLLNQTISLDDLKSLEIRYRSENNPNMLMSIQYQGEAIRKKIHELYEQYNIETEKIISTSKKFGLETQNEEESEVELKKIIEEIDAVAPAVETPLPRIPTLSLLIKPEKGSYLDTIELSGIYSSNTVGMTRQPVTVFIDNSRASSVTTDKDGVYHSSFQIEQINAGLHSLYTTSGLTSSEFSTLNITPVSSTISLEIHPVYTRPEVRCTGTVMANKPVRNAPVDLVSDFRTIVRVTTNNAGIYESQIRFSPGIHRLETHFVNDSYPIFSSRSPLYEIEASQDSILGIRLIDAEMSADELLLTIDPAPLSYGDTLNISGTLSGRSPGMKQVEIYIDGSLYRTLQTKPDGTYTGSYTIDRIKEGNHTIFAHYREPEQGELYSEPGHFSVIRVDSRTTLEIEMTDGGTALVCRGNITAGTKGVASAPIELVWDGQNIIAFTTDATGSFRQKITLPDGNHTLYARFNSRLYPINPSASSVFNVEMADIEISPALSLNIRPVSGIYKDTLTFQGTFIHSGDLEGSVDIFIDNNYLATRKTDATDKYSGQMLIERMLSGRHTAQARSGEISSDPKVFQVLSVPSRTTLLVTRIYNSSLFTCSGSVMAFDRSGTILRKPLTILDVRKILSEFWKNPLDMAKRPVSFAPVEIILDNQTMVETQTDALGNFSEVLSLPAGSHTISAQFINDSYPITKSKSNPVEVNIASANLSTISNSEQSRIPVLVPLVIAVILLLFIGGAVFYLHRKSGIFKRIGTGAAGEHGQDIPLSAGIIETYDLYAQTLPLGASQPEYEAVSGDSVFLRYLRFLKESGLSSAARNVYLNFTGRIAKRLHIARPRTLTPREFLRSCRQKPFESAFSSFVHIYEQVRYGGVKTPDKKGELEDTIKTTDDSLEREDH